MGNNSASLSCPANTIDISYSKLFSHPIPADQINPLIANLASEGVSGTRNPKKPHVFIMGHAFWNNMNMVKTREWLDQVHETITATLPHLALPGAFFPRLFMSPNAAGTGKWKILRQDQGNIALAEFTAKAAEEAEKRNMDHIGMWNMTIQSTIPDGT
jgi:hypothetical protein